ncbi:MAG TPA: protein kinase [Polyangiaceae bacterium]|nr:protein kinase [Polyangiaceae bacterium]
MKCEACQHQNIDGARFCANCGALMPTLGEAGADPLIGQLIGGRYRVTGVLGEGGMGVVYVGEQQMGSTVRKVAIKTLHAHLSKDPSVIARFHRECGTVAQLEHPNTIKFYDFGSTADGTLYIAMEFVAGKPLAEVLTHGPLSVERTIKIMRQVCGALDEAHMQGIIHRDLKPDNVILTDRAGETDFVKLLDFGIAARTESADAQKEQKLTQQGMVLGTPPYMSPEQFTGKALDARSDIYSLGVMTYEMLAGRLPFDADTPWQWATQHMSVQPIPFEVSAPAKNIPENMRKAILRALSKNKEDREPTAREYFAELSDGARITVESHPEVGGTTGTAAMAQVPDFSPPAAPVMVNPPHLGGGPAVAGFPPPPPMTSGRGNKNGGGKGLVIGLAAVGGILLISIAVLAARSLGDKKNSDADIIPINQGSAGSASTAGPGPGPGPVTLDPLVPTNQPSATPPPSAASATPTPTAALPPVAPVKTGSTNTGSGTKPPPPNPAQACDACIAAASTGNASAAIANFRSCTDSAKKSQCSQAARNNAPSAARTAALNGNCGLASAIIAGAQSMGATSPKLASALTGSSCK